jgi:hypothetical protein
MRQLAVALTLLALGACSETTVPVEFRNVQVSFSTQPASAALLQEFGPVAASAASLNDTMVTGSDTLILSSAQLVLTEVELQRSDVEDCDDDECEEFEAGPVLVDLPLAPGLTKQFELDVPAGTYTEIEFDVHLVDDDDPADIAFLTQYPEFEGVSVRVSGTFNGQQFLFESDIEVEEELDLNPPLTVADGDDGTNITVFVDIDSWFRDAVGDVIDPETANVGGENEGLVSENIENSFEAFEDDDEDGER